VFSCNLNDLLLAYFDRTEQHIFLSKMKYRLICLFVDKVKTLVWWWLKTKKKGFSYDYRICGGLTRYLV
jgi:hypothetical protein